jgi:prepilin peptidase CpaA
MNLIQTAPTWLLIILGLLLAAAAIEDAVRLRISNLTCLGVMLAAMLAMALAGFELSLWQNLVNFAVLLVVGTLLFATGKIGGGDVKLLAALGLWFSLLGGIWLIAAVFLAGGVFAVLFLLLRLIRGRKTGKENRGAMIPYGLAIVAGACFVIGAQLGIGSPAAQKPDPFKVRRL